MSDFTADGLAVPAAPRALPIEFTASGSEYFRIWIVNLLLILVTLGLYLPFAKARKLRYFYANTLVDAQPLAFHGDPWRMFRGHLIVVGVVLAYTVLGQMEPLVGVGIALVFMLLWPALWRASLIFRLRNTSWRGLRFDFTGTLGGAYKVFAPYLLFLVGIGATVAVLIPVAPLVSTGAVSMFVVVGLVLGLYGGMGLVMAWIWTLLKRYQHRGYRVASQQGDVVLRVRSVLWLGAKAVLLSLGLFIVLGLLVAVGAAARFGGQGAAEGMDAASGFVVAAGALVYFGFFFIWTAYFSGRMQDLIWNGTHSQELQFASAVPVGRLGLLLLKNLLLMIVTLGLYWPFAKVAVSRLRLHAVSLTHSGDLDAWIGEQQAGRGTVGEAAGDFFGFDVGL